MLKNQSNVEVQPKLTIGAVNDPLEQEADRMANMVMRMPENGLVQRKCQSCEEEDHVQRATLTNFIQKKGASTEIQAPQNVSQKIADSRGKGHGMSRATQGFMESRFGHDFSRVNIHTGREAANLSRELGAKAFTVGNDIYFNQGQYNPNSYAGRHLLAHELTHTIQQNHGGTDNAIQRTIELRPPGRGERSAFDRAHDLIARINAMSLAVSYSLEADGRTMRYHILFPAALNNFDFQMMNFIDLEQVIPMRLITSEGTVGGNPIIADSFQHGYVDLDDLLASDDLALQSILIHFLQERAVTNRYAQRIGSPSLNLTTAAGGAAFRRGHRAGHRAQERHWQDVMGDSSIRFSNESINARGDGNIVFRSRDHNYRIFITLDRVAHSAAGTPPRRLTGGRTRIRHNNQWFSVEDFINLGIVPGRGLRLRMPNFRSGFGIPRLQWNTPGTSAGTGANPINIRSLFPQPQFTVPPNPGFHQISFPPPVNLNERIDWLPINNELLNRGVTLNDALASSIIDQWNLGFNFFNGTLGFNLETSVSLANRSISMAVGAGLGRDNPSLTEQIDRELGTSSTLLPASDIMIWLINQMGGNLSSNF